MIGPELIFEEAAVVAVCGAEFQLRVDGAAGADVGSNRNEGRRADVVRLARPRRARVPAPSRADSTCEPVFGSRATSLVARMGPFGGRALTAGDRLPLAARPAAGGRGTARDALKGRVTPLVPLPQGGARLRVMWGPQEHLFTDARASTPDVSRYIVTPQSNRMGYRLDGPRLAHGGLRRHSLRRDAARDASSSGIGAADSAHGGSPDGRRLSEDRDRHLPPTSPWPGNSLLETGSRSSLRSQRAAPRRCAIRRRSSVALAEELRAAFGDRARPQNAPLAPLTTFKVGGPADWLDRGGGSRGRPPRARDSRPARTARHAARRRIERARRRRGGPRTRRPRCMGVTSGKSLRTSSAPTQASPSTAWCAGRSTTGWPAWRPGPARPARSGGAVHGNAHFQGATSAS